MQKILCGVAGLDAGDYGPRSGQRAGCGQYRDDQRVFRSIRRYRRPDRSRRYPVYETARRHGCRQEDRAHPQGHRRHRTGSCQTAVARGSSCATMPISSAGFSLTPNALAAADVSAQAKKFMVVMNAATSIITTKSPYIARTSSTTPQLNCTLGTWAAKHGIKTIYTMVSDYGPGHRRGEVVPEMRFKDGGAQIVGSVRFPVANPDFSAFVQAAKDKDPDAIYIWIPGGAQPGAVGKALAGARHRHVEDKGIGTRCARLGNRAEEHGRRRARHHHGRRLRL